MKDAPLGPMAIEKSDLFSALVRLYQLLRDTTFSTDGDDPDFTPDMELGDEADDDVGDDSGESEVTRPTPFSDFVDEHDYVIAALGNAYSDEFANLFATLATPLLADPELKEEFRRFASEKFGEDISFSSAPPPKAKLALVPPTSPDSPPSAPDVPPETPTT